MKQDDLAHIAMDGPKNVFQKATLLTMAVLAEDDDTIYIDEQALMSLMEIPTRNLTFTLNELIKKGWLTPVAAGAYLISPRTGLKAREGLEAFRQQTMRTNNWASPEADL